MSAVCADIIIVAAGLLAAAYLMQDRWLKSKRLAGFMHKWPPLQAIDRLGIWLLVAGFFLMTIGMVSGSLLAKQHWGSFWYLDPRQIWSLGTWTLCALILLARMQFGFRGRRAAILTLSVVALIGVGFVAMDVASISRHSDSEAFDA